jgi:hypothetical protein
VLRAPRPIARDKRATRFGAAIEEREQRWLSRSWMSDWRQKVPAADTTNARNSLKCCAGAARCLVASASRSLRRLL